MEGRLNKLKTEQALISQAYIRSETSESLEQVLKAKSKEVGETISIRRFVRYNLGEGLEKKNEDFAAEVAAQTEAMESAPAAPEPAKVCSIITMRIFLFCTSSPHPLLRAFNLGMLRGYY